MEDSDEKVNLTTMMHDLVRRYLAKLDQEITKFKMELEADSPGVTEILEKSIINSFKTHIFCKTTYSNLFQLFKEVKDAEQSGHVVKKESMSIFCWFLYHIF